MAASRGYDIVIHIYEKGSQQAAQSIGAVGSSASKAQTQVSGLNKSFTTFGSSARVATAGLGVFTKSLAATGSAAFSVFRTLTSLRTILVGYGITQAVTGIVSLTDAYTAYQNRIGSFVDDQRAAVQVQEELIDVALRSRSSLEGTSQVFQRLAISQRATQLSFRDSLTVVELLNKAIQASGVTSREAAAGIIQLGQALGRKLSGDELRSVQENLPFVANIVARQVSKEVGREVLANQLLAVQDQGTYEISPQTIVQGLLSSASEIEDRYSRLRVTFGSAFETLNTGFSVFVGKLAESRDIIPEITSRIVALGSTFADVGRIIENANLPIPSKLKPAGSASIGDVSGGGALSGFLSEFKSSREPSVFQKFLEREGHVNSSGSSTSTLLKAEQIVNPKTFGDLLSNAATDAFNEAKDPIIEILSGALEASVFTLGRTLLSALRSTAPAVLTIGTEIGKSFARSVTNQIAADNPTLGALFGGARGPIGDSSQIIGGYLDQADAALAGLQSAGVNKLITGFVGLRDAVAGFQNRASELAGELKRAQSLASGEGVLLDVRPPELPVDTSKIDQMTTALDNERTSYEALTRSFQDNQAILKAAEELTKYGVVVDDVRANLGNLQNFLVGSTADPAALVALVQFVDALDKKNAAQGLRSFGDSAEDAMKKFDRLVESARSEAFTITNGEFASKISEGERYLRDAGVAGDEFSDSLGRLRRALSNLDEANAIKKIGEQASQARDRVRSFVQDLDRELELSGLSGSPGRNRALVEQRDLLRAAGYGPETINVELQRTADTIDKIEQNNALARMANDAGEAFGDFSENATRDIKNVGDAAEDLFRRIQSIAFRQFVSTPLAAAASAAFSSALGAILGGGGSGAAFGSGSASTPVRPLTGAGTASSAAFQPGVIRPRLFAVGGIIDSPHYLGFSGGVPAIGGEGLSPEAVVPLPDGRTIPVMIRGGGGMGTTVVNNYFNIKTPDAESFRRSERQIRDRARSAFRGGS